MIARLLLALAATVAPSAASAEWHQATSRHFVVYANDKPERLKAFAEKLERFDKAVRVKRGFKDPPLGAASRLTVYVVNDVSAIEKLVGQTGVAGFYIPRASGSVAFVPRETDGDRSSDLTADAVFFHEYTHHLMLANYRGALPAWLVEGFAEFHSTARFQPDGSVWLGVPGEHRNFGLGASRGSSLDEMLKGDMTKMDGLEREALYGRGWVLTHMLFFEPSRRGQLTTYLNAMNEGSPSLDAARLAFGDLKQLRRDLDAYMTRPKLSYDAVPATALQIDPISVRPLRAGEAAFLPVRMRSTRGVNKKSALALVTDGRRVATRFPDDPAVQGALAEVEFDAGNFDQAEAAAGRALARDPRDTQSLIYMGRVKIARATAAKSTDPAVWRDARKWLVTASQVDTEDPAPKVLYHASFIAAKESPTRNAADALLQAHALAPQDPSLRLQVVRQYLIEGKLPEARRTMTPIVLNPHSGGSPWIKSLVARLDAGDVKGALAAYDSETKEDSEKN